MARELCLELINEEYADLSEKMIKKLGRKRDVPFARGKSEIWATAVVHALGSINFLSDKSFLPYCKLDTLCDHFKTNKSTVGNKAGEIRKLLDLGYYDSEFSTQHVMENNPFSGLMMTEDGFIVPKDAAPGLFDELDEEFEDEEFEDDFSELQDMLYDRVAIFVKPRKPFLDWIEKIDPKGKLELKPGKFSDGYAYLVNDHFLLDPEYTKDQIVMDNFINILNDLIFMTDIDPDLFPAEFSYDDFKNWFDCFVSITIFDLDED